MSTLMDHRIAERRARIREVGARRRLRWLLALIALAAIVGASAWLLNSPVLSVRSVTATGIVRSNAAEILEAAGVTVGVPTISIDEAAVVARLEDDPWIAAASVTATWPGTVEVAVLEYRPAGWITTFDGWFLASSSGAVLAAGDGPVEGEPRIDVGDVEAVVGSAMSDEMAVGSLQFVGALPAPLASGAVVRLVEDELYATVAGVPVRLGRPVDMAQKAATLTVLLEEGVPEGSIVNLVSALRPAIAPAPNLRPPVETETTG